MKEFEIEFLPSTDTIHCAACLGTGKAMNYSETEIKSCSFCEGSGLNE